MTTAGTAGDAVANLAEISREIDGAVIVDAQGAVLASSFEDEDRAARVAAAASPLLAAADERFGDGRAPLAQLAAEIAGGAIFVVRSEGRGIVAVTGPEPTTGLVFYDLKAALREAAQEGDGPKQRSRAGRSSGRNASPGEGADG